MTQKTRKIPKSTSFEDAMEELETIITQLESGDQPLEKALEQFERGVLLSRFCQQNLNSAEQKVKLLMSQKDGEEELTDFNATDFGEGQS